jgi:AcrR family transcriptional regulator
MSGRSRHDLRVPRKYELKVRAERQVDTRRRIVEATVRLHSTIGPARTTVTKIAAEAGVERLTVYRHFPEMHQLFQACAAHGLSVHPLPRPESWLAAGEPLPRLRLGLSETYGYYRENEQMISVILRDREAGMPGGARFEEFMTVAADSLAAGWPEPECVRPALGHAVDFQAWRSLAIRQGVDDKRAVDLMTAFVKAAAGA